MGLLDESYSEWFAYSIEKRVTTLFTWLVQCLIGGFCFGWTLTISFSVFFLLIRKYTNGYHAATYSKCLFCSILLEVVLLASISYVFRTGLALLFLTIVSDITILYIAPVNNKSIHWSTNEFKAAKIAVRWLLLILNTFAILLVGTQIAPSILQGLVAALTADAITLSISRCQN
ncbi:accessory gene regulator B family protein, partial [Faecalibacterium prausnitzii]|uniref:accessory gene regulator B family protein n=1 Tax=Faecalibacterium prausnitzii TaxID=853 RepID=UPI001BB35DC5